jgi:hypothetical protein
MLEACPKYCGMDFWELVAEQTNLRSAHDTLQRLRTTAAEILHLTKFELVIGAINLPPAKLHCRILLHVPDILKYG